MIGLRNEILRSATFAPRPHLDGMNIPASFRLPPMEAVFSDIAEAGRYRREGGPPQFRTVFMGDNGRSKTLNPDGDLPEPLAYNTALPNLFKFAYFTKVEDVSVELLEPVIWALDMFRRVLTECSEDQLRTIGHILPHQEAEPTLYFMLANVYAKLVDHLLNPFIDRPADALPHLMACEEIQAQHIRRIKSKEPGWQSNPMLYVAYSDALVFTNQFTEDTKKMLERILVAVRKSTLSRKVDFTYVIFKTKLHLALVLQQMKVEDEKQREYTEFCAKWLKKNPKLVRPEILLQLLGRPNQPLHPVLEALGGKRWLEQRLTEGNVDTAKMEERRTKQCRNCGMREPQVTLFRCSGCQHIYYCSKECQKANWKVHKQACKESARAKERAALLKAVQPELGQKASDWIKYRESPTPTNTHLLANALALQKDPSRGRTHIVFREVEYRPKVSKDWRHRFHATKMGVFKIKDVLKEIEMFMRLNPGEAESFIQEIYDEVDSAGAGKDAAQRSEKVPILDLTWGDGIETWLGSVAITVDGLRNIPYNPDWRKAMNYNGEPPEPLVLRSGVKDAEHDFS
ncbi:hypothetical protein K474DRAFT_1670734 [Panus rudis PR-1116 ss-1]|nr:hypothetical protein K474DRAFT_1670734 [Panus rudis PR-1116 ss-1]